MPTNWTNLSESEKLDSLRAEIAALAKNFEAIQGDLAGLSKRLADVQAEQSSTWGLVNEVVNSIDRIEART